MRAVAGEGLDPRRASTLIKRMAEQDPKAPQAASKKPLSPAAQRALAEAEARRRDAKAPEQPAQEQGRSGLDPVRYGDWEVKGIASDF
jgi:hypothetical protein